MQITTIRDVRAENINWKATGKRFRTFRLMSRLSALEAAQAINIGEGAILAFESGQPRKSTNIIWSISRKWDLSLNWLLNGLGEPHSSDPATLLPETLITEKGAGIRRDFSRVQAEEGNFSDHVLEFVMAVDKFKSKNQVPFPTLTQLYEIVLALGYRKSVPGRIAPLGYIIEHQQWAEKLKHMNEKITASLDLRDVEFRSEETSEQKVLPGKVRYNIKRREERQKAFENDPTLTEAEKERRRKIGARTREQGKKFLLLDPYGREHIVDKLPQFCRENKLSAAHMYSVANGQRKQHKGWKAKELPQSIVIKEKTSSQPTAQMDDSPTLRIAEKIKLGFS